MAKRHLGRNGPCWCGSGKKYKKCHLAADETVESALHSPRVPPARDYMLDIMKSILAPRQIRSDEVGPPKR